uniref:Uncharacterized protein n=1 Tax=Anguilla anguilla TaxID=7936 RepID=A0A0E9V9J7_ANGAN
MLKYIRFYSPFYVESVPLSFTILYGPKPSHSKKKATIARTTGCHIGEKTSIKCTLNIINIKLMLCNFNNVILCFGRVNT